MNVWKNHRFSFLLATGSLLMLLFFQLFWLNNSYQTEKNNLRDKADLVFKDAVRNIEDSIVHILIQDLGAPIHSSEDTLIKTVFKPASSEHHFTLSRIEEEKMIDVKIDLRTDFRKESGGNGFGSIALWMASDTTFQECSDSIKYFPDEMASATNLNLDLLEEKIAALMPDAGLPSPYQVVQVKKDSIIENGFYSNSHPYSFTTKSFAIFFPDYKNYLFQKILPQILFSFLLFGAILFSFFMVWKSLEKQRKLNELKNDFISNVTHELKTPITTVGVALEALSNFNALQNPERTEEYLNISKHELQRLSLLVDKVLKMSLFEKKEPELKLETFDMHALVQGVLRSMKLQFEKFSADVNFDFKGSDFSIKGDKIHLTNVVYNLIDNALKYSKEKPVINLLLKKEKGSLNLQVKDKGIGIAPNLKDKIFEKFFRVPQGDQHDVKGYGLGLSYVAGVIKKHQGNIRVNSQPTKGTTFNISLPTNYE